MNEVVKDSDNKLWDYSPALESMDHIHLEEHYDLFINGTFSPPASGKYFNTINPATEEVIAKVAYASKKDVDKMSNLFYIRRPQPKAPPIFFDTFIYFLIPPSII